MGSLSCCQNSIEENRGQLEDLKRLRCAPERPSKLAFLQDLKNRETELDTILEASKSNDPEELKKVKRTTEDNLACVNRWTDNIWVVKQYLTKKKGMSGKEVG
jgi:hypothetical protein